MLQERWMSASTYNLSCSIVEMSPPVMYGAEFGYGRKVEWVCSVSHRGGAVSMPDLSTIIVPPLPSRSPPTAPRRLLPRSRLDPRRTRPQSRPDHLAFKSVLPAATLLSTYHQCSCLEEEAKDSRCRFNVLLKLGFEEV